LRISRSKIRLYIARIWRKRLKDARRAMTINCDEIGEVERYKCLGYFETKNGA